MRGFANGSLLTVLTAKSEDMIAIHATSRTVMRSDAMRKKLTPPELARQWGVSPCKVVALIRSGELKAINLALSPSGRPRFAIDQADIEQFERSRTVIPQGTSARPAKSRQPKAHEKDYFADG